MLTSGKHSGQNSGPGASLDVGAARTPEGRQTSGYDRGAYGTSATGMETGNHFTPAKLDSLITTVRSIECRFQDLLMEVSSQGSRLSNLEREESAPRRAQAAAIAAMQQQQDSLLRLMLQQLENPTAPMQAGGPPIESARRTSVTNLEEQAILLKELREERVQVEQMLDNVKDEKLEVIALMHGFQVNKDLALKELEDCVMKTGDCIARNSVGSSTGGTGGGSNRPSIDGKSGADAVARLSMQSMRNATTSNKSPQGQKSPPIMEGMCQSAPSKSPKPVHAHHPERQPAETEEGDAVAAWKAAAAIPSQTLTKLMQAGKVSSGFLGAPPGVQRNGSSPRRGQYGSAVAGATGRVASPVNEVEFGRTASPVPIPQTDPLLGAPSRMFAQQQDRGAAASPDRAASPCGQGFGGPHSGRVPHTAGSLNNVKGTVPNSTGNLERTSLDRLRGGPGNGGPGVGVGGPSISGAASPHNPGMMHRQASPGGAALSAAQAQQRNPSPNSLASQYRNYR